MSTSIALDRLGFIVGHLLSVKEPCRVATTAAITLSGEQTIDGVAVVAEDRVLVKDQSDTRTNGIYECKTGEWELADDCDQRGHISHGTRLLVMSGTTYALTEWYVTTSGRPYPGREAVAFEALQAIGPATFTQSGTGAVERTWLSKMRESATIKDFGAAVDGSTNDAAAVDLMEAAFGFVRFPVGNTVIGTNTTIAVPVYFDPGAYVTISSGIVLTLEDVVDSPRQYIFRGSGTVSFNDDESRYAHVSWFGAFPDGANVSSNLTAITTAMGNVREALIELDVGVYYLGSTVTWNRATHLYGQGQRLTVFEVGFLTGDVFTTNGVACWFERFQFEVDTDVGASRTSGAYINLAHAECVVDDVGHGSGFVGVTLGAANCAARNILALVGNNSGAGSAGVLVTANGAIVDGVFQIGTALGGPENVVRVQNDSAGISNVEIKDIFNGTPGGGVAVISNGQIVTDVSIKGIKNRNDGGAKPYAAKVSNTGSASLRNVTVADVFADTTTVDGVIVANSSTGAIQACVVDQVNCMAISGNGLEIDRSGAGALSVTIGAVEVSLATTPISVTGSPTIKRLVEGSHPPNSDAAWRLVGDASHPYALELYEGSGGEGAALRITGFAPKIDLVDRSSSTKDYRLVADASAFKILTDATADSGSWDRQLLEATSAGSVRLGNNAALATGATAGFAYVPTCAGTPTGTPETLTGGAPIVIDTTNHKLYFYSGGAWRDAGP